jgi:hypothetical protein
MCPKGVGAGAAAGLGLERLGEFRADAAVDGQGAGAVVDDAEQVGGAGRLGVAVAAEPGVGESGGTDHGGQPPDDPAIVDEVLDERYCAGLERVGVAGGHAEGAVVAIEDRQRASWAQHPERLGEHDLRIGHVAEYRVRHGQVETSIGQREVASVALAEGQVRYPGGQGAGADSLTAMRSPDSLWLPG